MNNTHAPMVTFAERIQKLFTVTALAVVWMLSTSAQALADGTETLGTPSIAIASGSGIVAAGTGMVDQPGTIDIAVPAGATVNQVLLYWEGQMSTDVAGDDTIVDQRQQRDRNVNRRSSVFLQQCLQFGLSR